MALTFISYPAEIHRNQRLLSSKLRLLMEFLCMSFLVCAVSMRAQQTSFGLPGDRHRSLTASSLRGEVINSDGSSTSYLTVRITGVSGMQEAITDESGRFQFANLQPGTYDVVTTSGTAESRQTVVVSGGESQVTLRLDRPGVNQGPPGASVSAKQLHVSEKAWQHYSHALEDVKKHDFEKAMKDVTEAIGKDPCFADALTLKGVLELDAGHPDSTLTDSQKAIQCDASNAGAYFVMASAYNRLKRPDDAIRVANQGVRFHPDTWQPYFELGIAFSSQQRYDDAANNLRHAEQLAQGNFAPIHSMLGYVLFHMENYTDAATELRLFLKEEPSGPNAETVRQALAEVESQMNSANRGHQ